MRGGIVVVEWIPAGGSKQGLDVVLHEYERGRVHRTTSTTAGTAAAAASVTVSVAVIVSAVTTLTAMTATATATATATVTATTTTTAHAVHVRGHQRGEAQGPGEVCLGHGRQQEALHGANPKVLL